MTEALPPRLHAEVELAVRDVFGSSGRIESARPVAGGDIGRAVRLGMRGGPDLFLKWKDGGPAEMFAAEADGLAALAAVAVPDLRIPAVIAHRDSTDGQPSWILMEFLASGAPGGDFGERLGRAVARLHLGSAAEAGKEAWGWPAENFIGSLPQSNTGHARWASFWRDERIVPQLERARAGGWFEGPGGALLDRATDAIGDAVDGAAPEGPALLHGDLWGGNVLRSADGRPALVDPAVYRGDPEVDLAMSELFGFPGGFLSAYREVRPVSEAYERVRRPLYQLYYLLVHVNLFGGGYVAGCTRAAEAVVRGV